jgi:PAS domain S-box-containing protein
LREAGAKRVPGTLRVLLVEDSENDAMLLLRELRRGGYKPLSQRVYTPEDMGEALRSADATDEPFEVVISDYYMPRFRAPDALRLLRGLGYDLPFIVVSGKIGEDAAVEIMKAGADDYVTKENMSRLCPAIERELREAQVRRDRERAEKELVRSEDRFRYLVEQIPAVTYVQEPIDSDTPKAITYMSPQYEAMLGYPPEKEMLDEEHWLRVLHPDDRERVIAEELRTDETGEPYRIEYRQIARDGRVVWVRDEATLIRDEEGNALYWLGVQYDITEQKRTEEELKQSEERFKVLSQEVVEGIVLSENGRIIDANRSVTEMFGYGLEELIGKDAIELTSPEYREMVVRRISEEDTRPYESMGLKKDGSTFPLEIRPRHLPYSGRRIRVTSVIDLTERMHQEEALRQSEALYRTVVEQAEENIFLVDAKSRRVLDANDALLRSLDYTDDELKEMTLYDIVAHSQESVDINIGLIMEEGHRSLGERQYRRKDGSLADVEVNVSAVPYNGEKVMCIVAHDVTERKQAERMLEEIREAERNRLARELHDSTLQDIVYALQEVQVMQVVSGDDLNPALEDTAEALKRSVEGLRGAIFELRLKETLDRSLVSSLENLVDLNRRMARGRYELELFVEDDFPARLPNKAGQELTRLVQEALTNVRRHAEPNHARVELGLDGGLAYVQVSDDGCGFDSERATTGIGRQSMRHRALELGGEFSVQSAPGEGTRVRFSIPLTRLVKG